MFGLDNNGMEYLLYSTLHIPTDPNSPANSPGGSVFFGIQATGGDKIARIFINENDSNGANPDSNAGYDTFRFVSAVNDVPEPTSLALLSIGAAGLFAARRRRQTTLQSLQNVE